MDDETLIEFISSVRAYLQLIDQELDDFSGLSSDFENIYTLINKLRYKFVEFESNDILPFPDVGTDDNILIF